MNDDPKRRCEGKQLRDTPRLRWGVEPLFFLFWGSAHAVSFSGPPRACAWRTGTRQRSFGVIAT